MTDIFIEVSRSSRFPLVVVRSPHKDALRPSPHASGSSWIALGPYHMQVGLRDGLSRTTHRRLLYRASGQNVAGLVSSSTRWRPHHKCSWCSLARLQAPLLYKNGAHKHQVVKDMQTSLINNKPKPRTSAQAVV
jgi:hypothetical protein